MSSSGPHSDPETPRRRRGVGPWQAWSWGGGWDPESLPPKPLLSYTEPQDAGTSPREGFLRKGGRQGNSGGSKAFLETLTITAPTLSPPVPTGGH